MAGLFFYVFLIFGALWLLMFGIFCLFKKLFSSSLENNKEKLFYIIQDLKFEFQEEIRSLKKRIFSLENEINNLKGLQEQTQVQEVVSEKTCECPIEETQIIEVIPEENIPDTNTFESVLDNALSTNTEKEIPAFEENISIKAEETEKKEEFVDVTEKITHNVDVESYVAGNLLNRIGALALIIGMGFFLKYAFDQNWISPVVQILTGVAVSIGLLFGASHCHKQENYKVFAQGIAGAGISIFYLSIFAAYNFYSLINYPIAFVFMALLTILAFFQSLVYDSMAVALLGLAGGFITPFILSSGNANVTGLFTYLGFLNSWIIALLYKKENWKPVEIVSILTTYMIFLTLKGSSFYYDNALPAGIFLTLIWGLYFGLDISRIARGLNEFKASSLLNTFSFLLSLYCLLDANYPDLKAVSMFLTGLVYLASAVLVNKKWGVSEDYLKQNILTAVLLTVIATYIQFTGYTKATIFSLEAIGLLWLGIKYQKGYVWKSASYLYGASTAALLFNHLTYSYSPLNDFVPVFNLRFLAFIIVSSSMIVGTYLLNKLENTEGIKSYYRYSWCTLLFILLTVEISDFMTKLALNSESTVTSLIHFNKSMIQVIIWSAYSVQLIRAGLGKNIKPFIYCGFLGIIITVLQLIASGSSFVPIERFLPVINLRFTAFAVTAGSLIFISRLLKKHEEEYSWSKSLQTVHSYIWCIIVFILLSCEINDFFAKQMSYEISQSINFTKYMVLGLVWSLYSLPLIKKGLDGKNSPLIVCGSSGIVFVLLLGLAQGFSFYPIENFIPFLNLRMLMFAVLVAALFIVTGWLKTHSKNNPASVAYIKTIQVVLSLLILYVFTIEAKDFFAREMSVYYYDSRTEFLRNLKQLTMSGIWLMYSILLMICGILKKIKPVRYISLGILGIAVFKIFVIDLSFLDQLYRIISFIGLGVIMLSASYFYQKYSKQIIALLSEEKEVTDECG